MPLMRRLHVAGIRLAPLLSTVCRASCVGYSREEGSYPLDLRPELWASLVVAVKARIRWWLEW